MRITIAAICCVGLCFGILSAQDMGKNDGMMKKDGMKKEEMKKGMGEMGALKSISCEDACGFKVQSRDENELISMTKSHMKKHHAMDLTDAKAKEMMKEERNDKKTDNGMKK